MESPMNERPMKENKMGVMPVGKLLVNMALPMIISMMVQALYNVVDSIYVSRISESAVTALSLAFPVQNLQVGFAVGVGVGVNSLLSKSLGQKNQEQANYTAGNGMVLMLLGAAAFFLFGLFVVRPYYEIQSTVRETVEGGIIYTRICSLLIVGQFMQILGERLLQSTGRTVHSMIGQATGAITNIVLDPVFIFGVPALGIPAMGIAGAAVATVIGQFVGAAIVWYFNFRQNPDVHLAFRYLRLHKDVVGSILTVGIPSIVMNSIGSLMNFGMNQILQGFQETATGVFGIYFKLQSFFFMPLFGLNNATISVIAFNYGARNPERMVKTQKLSSGAAMTMMVIGLLVFQMMPQLLLGMFNPSDEFLRIGCVALRTISLSFPLASIAISLGAGFQALGNGVYSTIVSICRQMLVLLPVAWLMSLTGEVNNVWWAFPIAEVISAGATLLLYARIYKAKIKPLFE